MPKRCAWVPADQPLYLAYHDQEWGVPVHDDTQLFEMLTLEGAQAGLSWSTILNKREGYQRAFAEFEPKKVARFIPAKVERLLQDPGIVRNRLKVESTVNNAKQALEMQREHGSLDAYLWSFVGGQPLVGRFKGLGDIPAETAESKAMSKDLKANGFRFVGPTVCYAFMQAWAWHQHRTPPALGHPCRRPLIASSDAEAVRVGARRPAPVPRLPRRRVGGSCP